MQHMRCNPTLPPSLCHSGFLHYAAYAMQSHPATQSVQTCTMQPNPSCHPVLLLSGPEGLLAVVAGGLLTVLLWWVFLGDSCG
jgi:hypothetical protein